MHFYENSQFLFLLHSTRSKPHLLTINIRGKQLVVSSTLSTSKSTKLYRVFFQGEGFWAIIFCNVDSRTKWFAVPYLIPVKEMFYRLQGIVRAWPSFKKLVLSHIPSQYEKKAFSLHPIATPIDGKDKMDPKKSGYQVSIWSAEFMPISFTSFFAKIGYHLHI